MKKFANLYLALVFVILYLPIFYLIAYSFNSGGDMNSFTGFTLDNYQSMFSDSRLMLILAQTFFLAFLSALLATIIGTFGSIFIYESKQKQQTGILSLNNVLMVAPDVMIGASFLILFTLIGFQLGFVSVLLSHIAFSIPIVVLMVLPRLKEMNRDMVNAAYDLGATQWQMLREVMLPYLTPGIIAGYFMAFIYSLDDFAVTFFVTGNGFSTLAVEIYSRARKGISLEINALSTIIFFLWGISAYMQSRTGNVSDKLVIYNWGDYIDPDLLTKFTKETGIKVQYETFDSNEAMYTKIKQGGTTYDIAVPSDYTIDKMVKEDLLVKLDKSKIKGFDQIGSSFKGLSFDPHNDYSIPYFWGTVGIVYNTKLVKKAPQHWDDLWSPDYKNQIMLVDGAREVLGFSLNSLGYSLNTKNMTELRLAETKLNSLTPNIKAIVGDEMKGYMVQGDAAIGVTFSGEASEMLDKNEDLRYVVPSEGSNLWFDNLVIPKTVKHEKEAYAFINFMLKPENAAQNAEYIGYATPNQAAKALLPKSITDDKAFYPSESTIKNLEVYNNLGQKWLGIYNDIYLQVKMYRK